MQQRVNYQAQAAGVYKAMRGLESYLHTCGLEENLRRESSFYTERERAALTWTEAVTLITDGHASDDDYDAVRPHFDGKQLADLTLAIATINAWNRLAIAARIVPGTYQPRATSSASA